MKPAKTEYLSKREQQIMELVYQREKLTASELVELLPDRPSNSTVRTLLRILEERGHLRHEEQEGKFVYHPAEAKQAAAKSALSTLMQTYFQGSVKDVVVSLLSDDQSKLSSSDIAELEAMIQKAKKEGK